MQPVPSGASTRSAGTERDNPRRRAAAKARRVCRRDVVNAVSLQRFLHLLIRITAPAEQGLRETDERWPMMVTTAGVRIVLWPNSATIEAPEADAPSPSPSSSSSRGLADWRSRNRVSLAVTSYQSGRLILVGVNGENCVSMHHELLGRAMGLWADPQRLFVATQFQMWRGFQKILPPARGSSMPDR